MLKPILLLTLLGCVMTAQAGKVVEEKNPATGLSRWHTEGQDFSLELIQLLPDFVRAVYDSKGLPPEVIREVSSYCVFGTIVRNRADQPVSYNMADWRFVTGDGKVHHARLKSDWLREWRAQGVTFRWTLLTEAQTFQVGDWAQGFTTILLPHGTPFRLDYSWSRNGKTVTESMEGLRCAPAELEK